MHFSCQIGTALPLSRNIAVGEVVSDGKKGEEPEEGYNVTMDYHLMQAIDFLAMNAAEVVLAPLRRGTCFEHCTMTKLLDFDCIRLMEHRDVALLGIK